MSSSSALFSPRYQSYHELSPIDDGKFSPDIAVRELKGASKALPVLPSEECDNDTTAGWKRRISALNIFSLIWSTAVIAAAIGFLCFLWFQPNHNDENATWYGIVSKGWTARSVTLASLVIRGAVSVQAVLATSMLASLAMERHQVAIGASAKISVLRVANNGPWSLLAALWGSISKTKVVSTCILLLFVTGTLLQFTSTVLLSDLGTGIMTTKQATTPNLPVSLSWTGVNVLQQAKVDAQIAFWRNNQRDFPTFAESVEPGGSSDPRVRDTGPTIRAFVPYGNSTQRTSIKAFTGTATVVDSRVACVRPQIHPGLSVALSHDYGWLLNGTLLPDPEVSLPGLISTMRPIKTADLNQNGISINIAAANDPEYDVLLNWTQSIPLAHDAGQWNILQKLVADGPALVSTLDPRYPLLQSYNDTQIDHIDTQWIGQGGRYFAPQDTVALMTGHGYEALNVSLSENLAGLFVPNGSNSFYFSQDQDLNKLVITAQDEWLVFRIPRVHQFQLSVSLCFDSFTSFDTAVNITSNHMTIEPVMGPYSIATGTYDTEAIRNQLGALPRKGTNAERGIMQLDTPTEDLRNPVKVWLGQSHASGFANITFPTQNFLDLSIRQQPSGGMLMCDSCGMTVPPKGNLTTEYSNTEQLDLFNDILLSTRDTALAWQAYYTGLARMAYYDMLPVFDLRDSLSVASYSPVIFPQTDRGLKGVVVVLVVHFLLIALTIIAFFRVSRFSRLGDNAWQAIAQARAPVPVSVGAVASTLTDDEVTVRLKAAGMGKHFVRLQSWRGGKQVALWK